MLLSAPVLLASLLALAGTAPSSPVAARTPASAAFIDLAGHRFDPASGLPSSLAATIPASPPDGVHPGLHIVQFSGTIEDAWPLALRAAGAEVLDYVPQDAYLVWLP